MLRAAATGLAIFVASTRLLAQEAPGGGVLEGLLKPGNLAASSLLALVAVAFIRGWIVPAWVYDLEKKRADRMEERAWKATEALVRGFDAVEQTTKAVIGTAERKDHAQQ